MIRRLLVMGAIALACGGAVRVAIQPVPAKAVAERTFGARTPPQANGFWVSQWTRAVPACRSLHLAADGKSIAWVDFSGSVRRMNMDGNTLWQTKPLPGVQAVSATPTGAVLAYSLLNPGAPAVTVLHPRWGEAHRDTVSVAGAVWSVAVAPVGDRAFVGTADGIIRTIPLTPTGKAKQCRVPGIPEQLAVSDNGRVASALWMSSGVALTQPAKSVWSVADEQPARRFHIALSENGRTLATASGVGGAERDGRITVWEPQTKKLLWTRDLYTTSSDSTLGM